jgi:RimJ/RimL family protein N-acetyltransferase
MIDPAGGTARAVVRTRRLTLTILAADDADRVAEIGAQVDVAAMTISVPQPMTPAVAHDWISHQRDAMAAGTAATYAVKLRPDLPALGIVSLHHIDREHRCAELSFWFSDEARGQGYASEAAGSLVQYGFADVGLHRIEAYHIARNIPSARVLLRVGFRFEGTLRERVTNGSQREDVKLWAMLRTDARPLAGPPLT